MTSDVFIQAGICGFETHVRATSEDQQLVTFKIESTCEKVHRLAEKIQQQNPVDAYTEIFPSTNSLILSSASIASQGCCAGCVVPAGIFKAMQVAAGLALPKDCYLKIESM